MHDGARAVLELKGEAELGDIAVRKRHRGPADYDWTVLLVSFGIVSLAILAYAAFFLVSLSIT